MSQPASFSLAKALRDIDRMKPLSQLDEDELVALLHAWKERVNGRRDLAAFAKAGELAPRPSVVVVNED